MNKKIDVYLSGFKLYLRGYRDASENTIKDYVHDVQQYIKYFSTQVDATLETFCIDENHFGNFAIYLTVLGNTSATRARRLNGLQAFWRYIYKKCEYPIAPVSIQECGIRFKKNRNSTQSITYEEYEILMKAVYHELLRIE